nr:hypothetical protein [Tanacetum cinerariifolium]
MLELVKICKQKELYCTNDNVDDLIESALNYKLLSINLNSQRLNKKKQEVKNDVEQPAERRTRIIKSLQNFRVIHKSSTYLKNTSQISPVHAIAPILSTKEPKYSPSMGENEVTSEDKRECDMLVYENSPIFDDHSEIFSDFKNDDDISSDDDAFEDIEYIEASLLDPEIVSLEEENVVYHEEEEVDLEDIFQIQDVILREKLLSINRLISNIESLNDKPTPDHDDSFCFEIEPDQERLINVVKNDISDDSKNDPLLEEVDLFLAFDNSITSDAEFDFELDAGEENLVVMNDNDELECLDPRDEIDVSTNNENDDYFLFMFVIQIFLQYLIYPEVFTFHLSAESEDTIFDPGISV